MFLLGMLAVLYAINNQSEIMLEHSRLLNEQNRLLNAQNEIIKTDCLELNKRYQGREQHNNIRRLSHEFEIDPQIVQHIMDRTNGVLTRLALAVAVVESRGDFLAVGDNGRARGLFQMWPTTAQMHVGDDVGLHTIELHDIETSVDLFLLHFIYLLEHYEGDISLALAAYNRGKKRVDRLLESGHNAINGYPAKVLRLVVGGH